MIDAADNLAIEALTRAMAGGDEAAYDRYFRLYAHRLKAVLLGLTRGDEDLADEALQITLVKIARSVKRFDAGRPFFAWQIRIASNALRDLIRERVRRDSRHAAVDPPADVGEAELDLGRLLDECLADLPAEDRALVESFYFQGKPQAEIAAQNGASIRAVEGRLARIRSRLREAVQHRMKHEYETGFVI